MSARHAVSHLFDGTHAFAKSLLENLLVWLLFIRAQLRKYAEILEGSGIAFDFTAGGEFAE